MLHYEVSIDVFFFFNQSQIWEILILVNTHHYTDLCSFKKK